MSKRLIFPGGTPPAQGKVKKLVAWHENKCSDTTIDTVLKSRAADSPSYKMPIDTVLNMRVVETSGPIEPIDTVLNMRVVETSGPVEQDKRLVEFKEQQRGCAMDYRDPALIKGTMSKANFEELYHLHVRDSYTNAFGLDSIDSCLKDSSEITDTVPVVFGCDLAKSQDHSAIIGLNNQGQRNTRTWC